MIETGKAGAQRRSRGGGIAKETAGSSVPTLRYERDTVARNEARNIKLLDGLFSHGSTACMLNELALSQKPKCQGRTTEVTGRGLPKQHGRMSTQQRP